MTAVGILLHIAKHKAEFPRLKRYSPVQVLARMPDRDERYRLGEGGLRAVLGEVR